MDPANDTESRMMRLGAEVRTLRRRARLLLAAGLVAATAVCAALSPSALAVFDAIQLHTKNLAGTSDLPRLIIPSDDDTVVCRFENSSVNIVSGGLRTTGTERLTNAGALTSISTLDSVTWTSTAITFPGAGTVSSTGAGAMTIDSGTTGDANLGTGGSAKTVAIGAGTGGNIIKLGTSNVVADTINIASALDSTTMKGDLTNQKILYVKQATDITSTDTFALMGSMTLGPFTPSGTDPVVIIFSAQARSVSTGGSDPAFRIMIDGVEKEQAKVNTTTTAAKDVCIVYSEVLTAAAHTVWVEWLDDDSGGGSVVEVAPTKVTPDITSASLLVMYIKD